MPRYPYLIVGGGMTGDAAVRGIRELDKQGAIGLIGAEPDPPYAVSYTHLTLPTIYSV